MIKLIGAILLVGGATVLGLSVSSNLSVRVRVLRSFSSSLHIMNSEIGERLTPIPELMDLLSKNSLPPLDLFFENCGCELCEKPFMPFALIWSKQLSRADYLKLKSSETEVLLALGNVLGRYSAQEQRVAIEHALRCMDSMLSAAEEERKRLGNLYAKLGLICGIAVVIVFI